MRSGTTKLVLLASAICVLALGCASGPGTLIPVDPPAKKGSALPRLAVLPDGLLLASWVEPEGDGHALRFSTLGPDGWSDPRTAARGDRWLVNWADVPSIASGEGGLAVHWLERGDAGSAASDVLLATSSDGGLSWSEPRQPHRDGTETEHGFATIVPGANGEFVTVWLDGRERADQAHGARPAPMTLRATTVDRAGTLSTDEPLDQRVCDCCSTAAALTEDGIVVVAYRDRTDGEIRDISVIRRVGDAWEEPRVVHSDGWRVAACPVNGPAVASRGSTTAVAWFTGAGDAGGEVRIAFSSDSGERFEPPVRVDDGGALGRVDLALRPDGTALVLWLARREDGGRLMVREVDGSGSLSEPRAVTGAETDRSSGFPRIAQASGGTYVAWTEGSREESRVRIGRIEPL